MGAGRLGAARVGSLLGWCASAPVPEGLAFSGSPVNAPYFFPFPPSSPCTRRQVHSFCNAVGVVTSQIVSVVLAVGSILALALFRFTDLKFSGWGV